MEKYVKKCLNSLLYQTLREIEIICIDDGSQDSSLQILKKYALLDNRITIITQKNSYQGAARNKGLEIATGEYIHFLDADDYIELDAYELLYNTISKTDADLIAFGTRMEYEVHSQRKIQEQEYFSIKYNGVIQNFPELLLNVNENVWNKMYRKSFLIQ